MVLLAAGKKKKVKTAKPLSHPQKVIFGQHSHLHVSPQHCCHCRQIFTRLAQHKGQADTHKALHLSWSSLKVNLQSYNCTEGVESIWLFCPVKVKQNPTN